MNSGAPITHDIPTGLETESGGSLEDVSWLERSQQQVESRVRRFPAAAVVAALTAGVMLGWLIKRH